MKVIILAGGFGTRISEESHLIPKPMIEIGGMPILWHIMKQYSSHGFNEFIILAGYKQQVIKKFFAEYFLNFSNVTFDYTSKGKKIIHDSNVEQWKVTIVDTGLSTMTGGRIKRVREYIGDDENFLLTYGDGVSNVNIKETINFHKEHKKLATTTVIQPSGRFGVLNIADNNIVNSFKEKPNNSQGWINGGFMVLNKKVIDYIDGDETVFEREPLENIAKNGQLVAYKHYGFWQCMDTKRDKEYLEELWSNNKSPWKEW